MFIRHMKIGNAALYIDIVPDDDFLCKRNQLKTERLFATLNAFQCQL